jgi:protein phosphatase
MAVPDVEFGSQTDVGLVRSRNEDFMGHDALEPSLLQKRGHLFVVADGMGGHSAGNVASKLAVEVSMRTYYRKAGTDDFGHDLVGAIQAANEHIHDEAERNPAWHHMGTTVVAVVVHDGKAYVANVGDSRLYLVRNDTIQQITHDHSLVALQVELGNMTEQEAETSDSRNVLLRSLGSKVDLQVDLTVLDLEQDDILVLCTDGLHGLVTSDEIKDRVLQLDVAAACRSLVDLANSRGGVDNITVQVVRIKSLQPVHAARPDAGEQPPHQPPVEA